MLSRAVAERRELVIIIFMGRRTDSRRWDNQIKWLANEVQLFRFPSQLVLLQEIEFCRSFKFTLLSRPFFFFPFQLTSTSVEGQAAASIHIIDEIVYFNSLNCAWQKETFESCCVNEWCSWLTRLWFKDQRETPLLPQFCSMFDPTHVIFCHKTSWRIWFEDHSKVNYFDWGYKKGKRRNWKRREKE